MAAFGWTRLAALLKLYSISMLNSSRHEVARNGWPVPKTLISGADFPGPLPGSVRTRVSRVNLRNLIPIAAVWVGAASFPAAAYAAESRVSDVCVEIAKTRKPVAVLIGPDGRRSAGPVMLGSLAVPSDLVSDAEKFPSGFRVVVSPPSIQVRNIGSGLSVLLTKMKSMCANSSTYEVVLTAEFKRPGGIRPYKFENEFPDLYTEDQYGYEVGATQAYRFDHRLLGEFVEPRTVVPSRKR